MKDKKPRTDKRKNVGKVAEALINNPNKTVREIAKETGIGSSTVQRAKVEVAQTGTKDETIAYIVDKSKERIKTAQAIFDRYIQESSQKETLEYKDVTLVKDIVKDDLGRVTVLGGNVTDESGGLTKDKERWDNASIEDLLQFLKTK
ncbi:MAG TPA: hypothetical protein PLW93_05000 [Candidatus Absconditabacterales bacterium]|nr:hypothetical protein [Candidatus Absconditabacterales bacterium]